MHIAKSNIWMTLTKDITKKMEICQQKMDRKMLGKKVIDKVQNLEIRIETKVNEMLKEITKLKWKWT